MKRKILTAAIIVIIGFSEFITGCTSKNPIDQNLDKMETIIEKWEDKGDVSVSDISQFQQDITSISGNDLNYLMDEKEWTKGQKDRYRELQERAARLMQKITNP